MLWSIETTSSHESSRAVNHELEHAGTLEIMVHAINNQLNGKGQQIKI